MLPIRQPSPGPQTECPVGRAQGPILCTGQAHGLGPPKGVLLAEFRRCSPGTVGIFQGEASDRTQVLQVRALSGSGKTPPLLPETKLPERATSKYSWFVSSVPAVWAVGSALGWRPQIRSEGCLFLPRARREASHVHQ